jgi:hypothetical protein
MLDRDGRVISRPRAAESCVPGEPNPVKSVRRHPYPEQNTARVNIAGLKCGNVQ